MAACQILIMHPILLISLSASQSLQAALGPTLQWILPSNSTWLPMDHQYLMVLGFFTCTIEKNLVEYTRSLKLYKIILIKFKDINIYLGENFTINKNHTWQFDIDNGDSKINDRHGCLVEAGPN